MTVYVDAVFGLNGLLNYLMLLSSARLVAFSPAAVSPDGQFEALTGGCI